MLTFPVIGTAHSLDKLTDLSLAAVHRLADRLITGAILERSDNLISRRLRVPHRVDVYEMIFALSRWQKGIQYIQAWICFSLNIGLGSWSSGSWRQKIGFIPFPDPGLALAPEI
jgi:hypothetical protein